MISIVTNALLVIVVVAGAYYAYMFYGRVQVARSLVAEAQPFTLENSSGGRTLLVLGDSTAVGVGARTPEDSVAARVAMEIGAVRVENYARSGARVRDLEEQLAQAQRDQYDVVLIQVGGNNIINFESAESSAAQLHTFLATLPSAEKVVVLSAGNVGAATLFPWFMRPFYTQSTLSHHREFARVVSEVGHMYVNLYVEPAQDPFVQEPGVYLAPDGLHPSSEGYRVWFEKIKEAL